MKLTQPLFPSLLRNVTICFNSYSFQNGFTFGFTGNIGPLFLYEHHLVILRKFFSVDAFSNQELQPGIFASLRCFRLDVFLFTCCRDSILHIVVW